MRKRLLVICLSLLCAGCLLADRHPDYGKMSRLIRHIVAHDVKDGQADNRLLPSKRPSYGIRERRVCAFMRIEREAEDVFFRYGCRSLAQFNDIYIVDIPIAQLAELSLDTRVLRIEANAGTSALMDSVSLHINSSDVYEGWKLPQAYTGKGVVVGVQDIGFDLTHPNFYNRTLQEYRIKRLWDQLSTDTLNSGLYVGRDYTTTDELMTLGCSRDGNIQTHGTHTSGIAAGSGFDSPYRGIAYDSDICLVANATTEDIELIDSADYYKYTYATDALGFKYIFDYASSSGKPCVVSFSEGSQQDFRGDDVLYYEVLHSMLGPGRVLVAAAGNEGERYSYLHKPVHREKVSTLVLSAGNRVGFTIKSRDAFSLWLVEHHTTGNDTISVYSPDVLSSVDSVYTDSVKTRDNEYGIEVVAYKSCYDAEDVIYDVLVTGPMRFGQDNPVSVHLSGDGAEVELYKLIGSLYGTKRVAVDNDAECTHNIHSPSSAPCVISVGASSYRTTYKNYLGEQRVYDKGTAGQRAEYSSAGPTYDGRIKPDVLAPGTNIISSYSSYYLAANPEADDIQSDVAHFEFNGRTYAWNCNSGTSMSTPVVAGIIALWLQAKPDLTTQDIMQAIQHTSTRHGDSSAYPNNYEGYGQIDAYKGLLYLLQLDGIEAISSFQPKRVNAFPKGENTVRIVFDCVPERPFTVSAYAVNGQLIATKQFAHTPSTEYEWVLPTVQKGVLAIQINGGTESTTGSTLIRF